MSKEENKLNKILNKNESELNPIYLVYSEENYLLDEFENKFIDNFVSDSVIDFNLTYIDDEDNDFVKKLKNFTTTLPVMADRRYVVLKCVDTFTKKTKHDQELIKLFKNFPETTVLLIIVKDKIDKRIKINKDIKNIVEFINLNPPQYNDLDQWIEHRFNIEGKNINKKGINFLEHMYNNKLERLESEINKIITCFNDKEVIKYRDIKKIISKDRLLEENIIFDFVDALSKKNKGKALQLYHEMIEAGKVPFMILPMITRQIRLLLSVKELKQQGNSPKKSAQILGEHPYPIKKCYRFAKNFTETELEILLERILEANLDLVTGKYQDEKVAIEMALLEMK